MPIFLLDAFFYCFVVKEITKIFSTNELIKLLKNLHIFKFKYFYIQAFVNPPICVYSHLRFAFIFAANYSIMPSFDIASKVDLQTLDNAINTVKKEIENRFDFKNSHVVISLNKKDFIVSLEAESDMKLQQVVDVIISRSVKQGIDANAFDFEKEAYPSGKVVKKEVSVCNGLKQDDAKIIVKLIKDSGLKVQAAIMDNIVRVTAKKIDDLQDVIALCKSGNLGFPLQFDNMKS